MKRLPMPGHYNAKRAGEIYFPAYMELEAAAAQWAKQHNIQPASADKVRVCVMPIDMQITFCHPKGELPVKGAVEDCQRTAEFIYANLPVITQISPTLDTHLTMQIFHPIFLVDKDGNHPTPGIPIPQAEVLSGKWQVNPAVAAALRGGDYMWLQNHLRHYVEELAKGDKSSLIPWPYHAMLGGIGHALMPIMDEAIRFHTFCRASREDMRIKGGNPFTENYSVIQPEVLTGPSKVKVAGQEIHEPIAQKNADFVSKLLGFDMLILPGEAGSHCLAWTAADLLNEIVQKDRTLAEKVYIMTDCTSPVVIPGVIDFTQAMNDAFSKFEAAGMHLVKSTTPIEQWPDSPLK